MNILICDDDNDTAGILALIVGKEGHTTDVVHTCEAVWKVLKDHRPDLILMDMLVPAMGGESAIKALKKDKSTRDIKVVMVSAHPDLEERAALCKADGHLEKPFQVEDLRKMVRKYSAPNWANV